MALTFSIECILDCQNHLGEGPLWDCETEVLHWVDSTGPRVGKDAIWRLDPRTGAVNSWSLAKDVGAMALRQNGGGVLALSDGFYGFDFETGEVELIAKVDDDPARARLNDGKCDRMGRFFAGGMDDQEELGICGLWRLDPDLSLHKIEDGIICSNGPCWSPDDATFYFADTFKDEIWAYDYDLATGIPANKRVFASTEHDTGFADGSTVDAEGYLWNAQVISGDLIRYAPDGTVDRKISMPVRNITSVMFGGTDLKDIYVTSMARVSHPAAHDGFEKQAKPQFAAGSLFRIRGLGIQGVPEPRFAG
ncbi:MAG: SMP-30/gluconolactonase/LRE family protein [Pseudomonadota bacterium]